MSLSGFGRRRRLRIAGIVLALAGLLVLPGCWVTSINPLYEEGTVDNGFHKDPDVVFEPSLLGSWTVGGDKCTAPLSITSKDNAVYELERKEGEGCTDPDKPLRLQGRLVKVDGHYFFDISPSEDDVCDMCLAKHNIFLMKIEKNSFSLVPIDSDWLKNSIAAKNVILATLGGDTDTITASSKDLKAFCRRYAEDREAFKADPNHADTFTRK